MHRQTEMLALVRQVHMRFATYFSRKCAKEGISLPQYMLLMSLLEQGSQKMSSLASFLQISTPSVTNLVDKLESADYARRVPDPGDRRVNIIELTPAGEKFVTDFRRESLKLLADLIGRMPPADQKVIRRFYRELISSLDTALGRQER